MEWQCTVLWKGMVWRAGIGNSAATYNIVERNGQEGFETERKQYCNVQHCGKEWSGRRGEGRKWDRRKIEAANGWFRFTFVIFLVC
jgi:hypothetical protein